MSHVNLDQDKTSGPVYQVKDLTATAGPRSHELSNGQPGDLEVRKVFVFTNHNMQKAVPVEFARSLIGNSGFEVRDEQGNLLIPRKTKAGGAGGIELKNDECVANYSELTQGALFARAVQSGGKFNKSSSKNDLIAHLITNSSTAPSSTPAAPAEEDVEVDVEEDVNSD